MHLACVLAFLSASALTLGVPIDSNNAQPGPSTVVDGEMAMASPPSINNAHGAIENGVESMPEPESIDKRFYYNNYTPLEKRFYYNDYRPLERRTSNMGINGLKQMQPEWDPATTNMDMDMDAHDKRFYYHLYTPLERRFYYNNYTPLERRSVESEPEAESLDKRFYYNHYLPVEARDMKSMEKRFYYNNYEPLAQ